MSGPAKIAGYDHGRLHEVSAGLETFAGTRLVTLEDGPGRGMRLVEMRTGGGLDFDVTVDRSGDIGRLVVGGQTLSWHPAGGLPAPWLIDREGDAGQGFLRAYGGFLNTCGLDHIRQPETEKRADRVTGMPTHRTFPLHGKGTFQPANLLGHGLVQDADQDKSAPYVFCETEFAQAMSFESALGLRRRIEAPVGKRRITIRDEVRNIGNDAATHMLLYHFNLGFPLVAEGTRIDIGRDACIWQSEPHDPLACVSPPRTGAQNVISVFRHDTETARIRVGSPHAKLAFQLEYPKAQLPYCQILRMQAPGVFGIGIEPCTTEGRTRQEARDKGEMIILQPGETRQYSLTLELADYDGT